MTDVGQHRDGISNAEWEAIPEGAPPTRTQNFVARTVRAVALALPYGLVALVLRLVMARAFFVAGQAQGGRSRHSAHHAGSRLDRSRP